MIKYLIETQKLKTWFPIYGGILGGVVNHVKAVDGVDFYIKTGEVVSLVGESGSGKSTLGYTLLGLTPATDGTIWLDGNAVDLQNPKSWDGYRKQFQIIFQDSHSSLNPKQTIFEILAAPILHHNMCSKSDLKIYITAMLNKVGLGEESLYKYPHAFSGGQRQRISIARAIALKPRLIICDEVVSALDVTIQAQILDLLIDLKKELNLSLLFISHDMAVVKQISDRVYVMYYGKFVEQGSNEQIFTAPQHTYTKTLLSAVPSLDPAQRKQVAKNQ